MRVDFHVYTDRSIGKNTVAEMAAVARKRGLDALAVTDRGVLGWKRFSPRNFTIVPGLEIVTDRGPVLVYGAESLPEKTYLEYVLDWAKDWGYVVVPAQFNAKGGMGDEALERFEVVEAINGSQPPWLCRKAVQLATARGRKFLTSSGARSVRGLGEFYTNVEAEDAEGVLEALRKGKVEPRIKLPGMAHFLSSLLR